MLSFAYPNGPHLSHGMIDTRIDEITTGSTEKKRLQLIDIQWIGLRETLNPGFSDELFIRLIIYLN
jgi:hypothetical protein